MVVCHEQRKGCRSDRIQICFFFHAVTPVFCFWATKKADRVFDSICRIAVLYMFVRVHICHQRENDGFTSTNSKVEKSLFGQQKTPIKSGFFVRTSFLCPFDGGEGEIRTLEQCYPLHDFQSCALDQLGDFSVWP